MQQPKGILDRVLQFMGIQEDREEPRVEERPEPAPPPPQAPRNSSLGAASTERDRDRDRRRGRLVSLPGPHREHSQLKVAVMHPRDYEEVEQIADHLKERQPVIISLERLDKAVSRRIVDFISGATYALDGDIHRIGEGIFLVAPINVSIDAELARTWQQEEELFS